MSDIDWYLALGTASLGFIFPCLYWFLTAIINRKATCVEKPNEVKDAQIRIFYSSQTRTAEKFSHQLAATLSESRTTNVTITSLAEYDPEGASFEKEKAVCVFLVSTHTGGEAPAACRWFFDWLNDASYDFRFDKSFLSQVRFAIFGLGSGEYGDNFNKVAVNLHDDLVRLQAKALMPLCLGDDSEDMAASFKAWALELINLLQVAPNYRRKFTEKNVNVLYESSSDEDETQNHVHKSQKNAIHTKKSDDVIDLEEIGNQLPVSKIENGTLQTEMLTPSLRQALSKQGYRLIGSHSGVKLCRWTKAMLRGRGGCYKHTFYGIESHRCMETTPSLACANKCVFCWRHHSNPVGTKWRWKVDEAKLVFDGAVRNHLQMIRQMKGVPGVKADRFAEAQTIKHCALSLVGEPIMYPEINGFIQLLHAQSISTFMVTNAQFPDAIRNLAPVTQLYVSVDAATKESLKKIDRPLFRDFWERFNQSLEALSEKKQRTVYRLTLVKSWNAAEIDSYAQLINKGRPDFIEIKGVTYCGDSKASSLTMQNVPWHAEVVEFVLKLVHLLPNYEIACEHEHSNCILVAHEKFRIDGRWHTWIDYDKFHRLCNQRPAEPFTSLDYVAPTPHWAVVGSQHQGFDPEDTRWFRKSVNKKDLSGC